MPLIHLKDTEYLLHLSAIQNRLIDYCRLLDRMNLDNLVMGFTEDCRVEYGPDPRLVAEGRQSLKMSLERMWRWRSTAHHLTNVRVWLDSADLASAESSVWAWHETPEGSQAEVYGLYFDQLERVGADWLISERRMEMQGSSGEFRVKVPPTDRFPPPEGWVAPQGLDD